MSNHFTGLSLGPPLGDQRLDLCDLYAFQSPADKDRTVIILNANPNADALHPDAIYRVNIDNDGDYLTDIAFSYVFSKPQNGRQTVDVFIRGRSRARLKQWERKSSPTPRSRSGRSRISSGQALTPFSLAAAAMPSFSTSTESRTYSTSAANGTSPSLISAASRHGPASIRTQKRTSVRPRSSCRRVKSIPSLKCTSGAGAVCDATASCFTSIAPAIRA